MAKKSLLILPLLLGAFFYVKFITFKNKTNCYSSETLEMVKNGDLVLRCGRSVESFTVYTADKNSQFSHIGIISIELLSPAFSKKRGLLNLVRPFSVRPSVRPSQKL